MIMKIIIDSPYLLVTKSNDLAIVKIRGKVFELITNLDESQLLTNFIRETEYDREVKGLMILSEPECLGAKAYDEFMEGIIVETAADDKSDVTKFSEGNTRFREIHILNKFIKLLASYQKLYIAGISCDLATPFAGVFLVADFRMATPGTSFTFAHNKYGLHPNGGLPFILNHYLGHSRALEVMLSTRISAEEALKLGLINYILPSEDFETQCVNKIKPFLQINSTSLRNTKRLANFNNKALEEYFEYEASILNL